MTDGAMLRSAVAVLKTLAMADDAPLLPPASSRRTLAPSESAAEFADSRSNRLVLPLLAILTV